MDKGSYIDYWIDLPPTHIEVFKKILKANKIEKVQNLVALSENEFKNIEGITPLMLTKTKEILERYEFHFGMTAQDILEMENKSYFQRHKDEEDIAKGESGLIKEYLDNAPKDPHLFAPEILATLNIEKTHEHQSDPEPIMPVEDEDIYGIADDEDETVVPVNTEGFRMSEPSEEEIKARKEAEYKRLQKQIDRRKARAYNYTSPMADCDRGDLEWFRFWMILDSLRDESWFYKLITPYSERVHRAIVKGNYIFKKWLEDAKERHYENKTNRETLADEIHELVEKKNHL